MDPVASAVDSGGVSGLYTSFEIGPEFGVELQGVVTVFVGANSETGERYLQISFGIEVGLGASALIVGGVEAGVFTYTGDRLDGFTAGAQFTLSTGITAGAGFDISGNLLIFMGLSPSAGIDGQVSISYGWEIPSFNSNYRQQTAPITEGGPGGGGGGWGGPDVGGPGGPGGETGGVELDQSDQGIVNPYELYFLGSGLIKSNI